MFFEPVELSLQASDDDHRLVDGFCYRDASVVMHYLEHISDPPVVVILLSIDYRDFSQKAQLDSQ